MPRLKILMDTKCPNCNSEIAFVSGGISRVKGTKKIPDAHNGYVDICCKNCDFWTTGRTMESALNKWREAACKAIEQGADSLPCGYE